MLRLRDLRKSFGPLTAVDGLSLDINRGEVFGLLGPNGAGKSTTIGMCVGLIAPDSGTVEIDTDSHAGSKSHTPVSPDVRRRLGLAPQSLALYDDMTGDENLRFFGRLYGLKGAALTARCDHVLSLVQLVGRREDRVGGYSGGMKRRLNLAVALIHDPPLVLMDEPTAGVDPQSRHNILELVRTIASQGRTVVYTTHYIEEAAKVCDRVGIVDRGKVLALGTVHELIAMHGGKSVVTIQRESSLSGNAIPQRIETDDPVREISAAMSAGGVTNVRIDRPDLESVFLTLTGRSLRD
jgi:ABC-2 type transport system ATP-binding protein